MIEGKITFLNDRVTYDGVEPLGFMAVTLSSKVKDQGRETRKWVTGANYVASAVVPLWLSRAMTFAYQMADTPTSEAEEKELCGERWSTELLDRISGQRADGRRLCDVVVRCDDGDAKAAALFPVHRCVLAASSEYFRALFSNGLGEMVVHDGVCHVDINTSLPGVSRDVVSSVR